MGVLATPPYELREARLAPEITHSVFPGIVQGAADFNLLAVWAHRKPAYVEAIWAGLNEYATFIKESARPTVMVGDFNSHSRFDAPGKRTHKMLEERLLEEFGLVSAWHALHGDKPESSTHYFHWKEEEGFHIDYCFIPQAWASHVTDVSVPPFVGADWRSDHRPLVVDIALTSIDL